MPKQPSGERVLGPYRYRDRFRVVLIGANGDREDSYFAREEQAQLFVAKCRSQLVAEARTTDDAIEAYVTYMRDVKGNKPASIKRTRWSLAKFFPAPAALFAVRPRMLQQRYDALVESMAVDSHRNVLAETKTFLGWCVERKWMRTNPAAGIKGVGRRNKGKTQLRFRDLRKWVKVALVMADEGDEGALAALLTVVLGLRAGEIVGLRVGDLDELDVPGDTLHIADAKTRAGVRTLEVPDLIRGLLLAQAEGKPDARYLFQGLSKEGRRPCRRSPGWIRANVQRICDAARVERVTAHAMRGASATVALRQGAAATLVAAALGHEDSRTTLESYAAPGAADSAARSRLHNALVN